jgi:3-methylcrotonyl-CoA carboxylase alpha subunit
VELDAAIGEIGLPLLIKAAHGGGGRGQRVVRIAAEFDEALRAARSESLRSFGSDEVFVERYLDQPRHIEVQILGDSHKNVFVLGERDCTLQRRNQKIVEEAPAAALDDPSRKQIYAWAQRLGETVEYENAGTIEFLAQKNADQKWDFYFMELNARLQVEHPVTEMILGIDIVEMQFRTASGENLTPFLSNLKPEGHAIELRLCAEDPVQQFLPTPGPITDIRIPDELQFRIDTGFDAGDVIPQEYDSLFAKMILHRSSRDECIRDMESILDRSIVAGIITNKYFLREVLRHPDFENNAISTHWIQNHPELVPDQTALDRDFIFWGKKLSSELFVQRSAFPDLEYQPNSERTLRSFIPDPTIHGSYAPKGQVRCAGDFETPEGVVPASGWITRFEMCISFTSAVTGVGQKRFAFAGQFEVEDFKTHHGPIIAQVPGVVLDIRSKAGEIVEPREPILIVEAMKIEMPISLPVRAKIIEIQVKQGDRIQHGQTLILWEPYNLIQA